MLTVFTVREAIAQPHPEHRESFTEIDDGAGPLKVPNPAFQFKSSTAKARNYVPELGADNANVLTDVLGYSKDRIAELRRQGVLCGGGKKF